MYNRTLPWYNENSLRSYPFIEDSDLTFTGPSSFILPNDVILDFQLVLRSGALSACRLTSIVKSSGTLSFTFTYDSGSFVAEVPMSAAAPYEYRSLLAGTNICVVFGEGISSIAAADGTYTGAAALEPSTFHTLDGTAVNSIKANDTALTGAVALREGYNCSVSVSAGFVRVSAVRGAGLGIYCGVYETPFVCDAILLYINGMRGSSSGDFNFTAGNGINIESDQANHAVIFRTNLDKCEIACGGDV